MPRRESLRGSFNGRRSPNRALITCRAAGMTGAIAVCGCGVQRAAAYQRQRPEPTVGL